MDAILDRNPAVWASAEWRAQATAWADAQLVRASMVRIAEVKQPHLRPWATVLEVPTREGPVWLKASGHGTAFEVALYQLLHRVVPHLVLAPIASDVNRGWLLLPDGGPRLGDGASGDDLARAMVTILPSYAELQRALSPHVDALIALGVTDMRASMMPRRFDEALAFAGPSLERRRSPDELEKYARLRGMRDKFVAWCNHLAAAPAPSSLDHNDLHPWNILAADSQLAAVKFYDWGDSVIAHPFASMLVPLRVLRRQLETREDDPRIVRVRDAYLESFTDCASHPELVRILELACRTSKVARALAWIRTVQPAGEEARNDHEFAQSPFENLASLLDDSYLA